jgi:hypothetical protein
MKLFILLTSIATMCEKRENENHNDSLTNDHLEGWVYISDQDNKNRSSSSSSASVISAQLTIDSGEISQTSTGSMTDQKRPIQKQSKVEVICPNCYSRYTLVEKTVGEGKGEEKEKGKEKEKEKTEEDVGEEDKVEAKVCNEIVSPENETLQSMQQPKESVTDQIADTNGNNCVRHFLSDDLRSAITEKLAPLPTKDIATTVDSLLLKIVQDHIRLKLDSSQRDVMLIHIDTGVIPILLNYIPQYRQ